MYTHTHWHEWERKREKENLGRVYRLLLLSYLAVQRGTNRLALQTSRLEKAQLNGEKGRERKSERGSARRPASLLLLAGCWPCAAPPPTSLFRIRTHARSDDSRASLSQKVFLLNTRLSFGSPSHSLRSRAGCPIYLFVFLSFVVFLFFFCAPRVRALASGTARARRCTQLVQGYYEF